MQTDSALVYNGKTVDLKWTNASEKNSDHFNVQRSADGKTFYDIIKVKAAGNSSTLLNYSSEDKEPLSGISYYRLKQTDFDGKESFSDVVTVNIDDENDLLIQNISSSNGMIHISIICNCINGFSVEILDMTGRKIFSRTVNRNGTEYNILLPAASFSKEMYLLKASDEKIVRVKKLEIRSF